MKSISSSIIVFAAVMLIIAGLVTRRGQDFSLIVGCILGMIGLIGWAFSMENKEN